MRLIIFLTSACSLLLDHNPELLLCLTRGSAFRQLEWFSVLQSKWREEGSTETAVKSYLLIISSHKKKEGEAAPQNDSIHLPDVLRFSWFKSTATSREMAWLPSVWICSTLNKVGKFILSEWRVFRRTILEREHAFTFQVTRASSWEHLGYRVDRLSHRSIIPSNYTFEMEMFEKKKKKSNIYICS